MPSSAVLLDLAVIAISFILGIGVYYLISTDTKDAKKKQLENVISLTINFIIYIWLGKILINIGKFIKDPFSILAYPSNSYAVYVATIFLFINLLYRKYRHNEQISSIIFAFIPVFLIGSFVFEFLQFVVDGRTFNLYYLILLSILAIGYIFIYGKISLEKQSYLFGLILLVGQLLLTAIRKATIFDYRLSAVYFVCLFIIVVIVFFTNKRKV